MHFVKPSRYNVRTPKLGAVYNASTGNYVVPTAAQRELLDGTGAQHLAVDEHSRPLLEGGFLVPEDLDELASVRLGFEYSRRAIAPPHLTISPTIDCNFGCEYCFETHQRGNMIPPIQDALLAFTEDVCLARSGPKRLSVSWFGGEPLMAMPVIRRLTAGFRALIERGVMEELSASIVTNGYMATPRVVDELAALGITQMQITVDGARELHDQRRILKRNGAPTFDHILGNIAAARGKVDVLIRMNADRSNIETVPELMASLEEHGLLEWCQVHIDRVSPFRLEEVEDPGQILGADEFAQIELALLARARDEGWPLTMSNPRPAITGVCQVDRVNSFVIAPSGQLMKCWAELGNRPHQVGHLAEPSTWHAGDELTGLASRDVFDDADCCACPVLPLCMGTCPLLRRNRRGLGLKECPPFKHTLPMLVEHKHGSEAHFEKRTVIDG